MAKKMLTQTLQYLDLTKWQLDELEKIAKLPQNQRRSSILEGLYMPYESLWKGYIGDEKAFVEWIQKYALSDLGEWKDKSDSAKISKSFEEIVQDFSNWIGVNPSGRWYVFFGPGWTDLGGFGDGTMIIDLANPMNRDHQHIINLLPHELSHQIYAIEQLCTSYNVLKRCIDEGLACYVSNQYHQGKLGIAKELLYSDAEYEICRNNTDYLMDLLKKNANSIEFDLFFKRDVQVDPNFPGAIGYFMGYLVVQKYLEVFEKDVLKKIYRLPPKDILSAVLT